MKKLFVFYLILFTINYTNAQQSSYWGQLTPGQFNVGYQDTIIFNKVQSYSLGNYKGSKPFFISMWFPLQSKVGSKINYNEYLTFDAHKEITNLIDSIQQLQYNSFISSAVTYNLDLWENEELSEEKQELATSILNEPLNVFKTNRFPLDSFPTIVYHHGNGGISFENSLLFEFLASYGYVIISTDYHWPNLRSNSYTHKSTQSLKDVDYVIGFASGLPFVNTQKIYFLGHSWGGGIALRLNQKRNTHIKQYLIFDSTIEKAIIPEMKALNPHIDSLLQNHAADFKTKTTIITARASYYEDGEQIIQPYPQFIPYQFLENQPFIYITLKEVLNHGSFTSLELLKNAFIGQFIQNDSITVQKQFLTYQELVLLTKIILDEIPLDTNKIIIYEK